MKKISRAFSSVLLTCSCLIAIPAHAQTLATGDSRTVTQPTYPTVCTTLTAQFSTSQRASPPTTDDTSRLQAALNSCAGTGGSVVLATSGSNNAFYTGSLTISGAGIVVNSGVTLYGNNSYSSNANLLSFSGTNASLMGPGTVDGRGDIISGTPRLVQASNITNFIVYNVTLAQAAHPNLYVEGGSGFTAWNVSIRTPATRANADGIDIDSLTNATVINSDIEAGDDGVAVKTNSGNISNVTVSNTKLHGTHGLSVGSIAKNTVSNILFKNNYVYGNDLSGTASTDANAINVKADPCSLTVQQVSYVNTCITNAKHLIVTDTNYSSCSTGGTPTLSNIIVNGAYSTASLSGAYTKIDGRSSSYPVTAYLANVSLDATAQSGDQYATVGLYNSNVTPSGTGVTTSSFTLSGSVPSCSF
ncbi:glycoside hydrolase family 28 [Paraburkholderia monticola]|uniref:Glycoside hydrolase family 28 n=1 Tax=Paraburkholderia monticola TaxID=1399968 RepID=A0A149PCC4_9BURK|nr:glycosyl hydrolase family 28 protein [Paraburkholderia monticola]KXU82669.1 glycoside hydrolase family 28 [Paraburkholderia monticola]